VIHDNFANRKGKTTKKKTTTTTTKSKKKNNNNYKIKKLNFDLLHFLKKKNQI